MGKLAEAYVDVGANLRPLESGLARAKTTLSGFARTQTIIPGSLKGSISAFGAGGVAALGAGAGVAGIAEGLLNAAKKAADLGETISKVKVTFGDSSQAMIDQANLLAERFGVVKREALDATAAFGLMGVASGLSKSQAAALGQEFVQLGLDMASYHNISNVEAFEKLRSGLAGEAEPLRPLGILLSEDAVKAEALAMGIAKVKRELTDAEKVAARASLIKKQAGPAIGDLERTGGSEANQLRKLQGQVENFLTDFGTKLQGALGDGIRLATELAAEFGKLSGPDFAKNFGEMLQGGINVARAGLADKTPEEKSDSWALAFQMLDKKIADALGVPYPAVSQRRLDELQRKEEERIARATGKPLEAAAPTPEEKQKSLIAALQPNVEESKQRFGDRSLSEGLRRFMLARGRPLNSDDQERIGRLAHAELVPEAARNEDQQKRIAQGQRVLRMEDDAAEEERLRKQRIARFEKEGMDPKALFRGIAKNIGGTLGAVPGLFGNAAESGAAQAQIQRNNVLGLGGQAGGRLLNGALALGRNIARAVEEGPENARKRGEKEILARERAREKKERLSRPAELYGDSEDYGQRAVLSALESRNLKPEEKQKQEDKDHEDREKLQKVEEDSNKQLQQIVASLQTVVANIGRPVPLVPR